MPQEYIQYLIVLLGITRVEQPILYKVIHGAFGWEPGINQCLEQSIFIQRRKW